MEPQRDLYASRRAGRGMPIAIDRPTLWIPGMKRFAALCKQRDDKNASFFLPMHNHISPTPVKAQFDATPSGTIRYCLSRCSYSVGIQLLLQELKINVLTRGVRCYLLWTIALLVQRLSAFFAIQIV